MDKIEQQSRRRRLISTIAITPILIYLSITLFLLLRQRHLIYRPNPNLSLLPSAPDFDMPYEDVAIEAKGESLHGWWIPAGHCADTSVVLTR